VNNQTLKSVKFTMHSCWYTEKIADFWVSTVGCGISHTSNPFMWFESRVWTNTSESTSVREGFPGYIYLICILHKSEES